MEEDKELEFDLSDLKTLEPVTTIVLAGHEWPIYPLTYDDLADSGLIGIMAEGADTGQLNLLTMMDKEPARFKTLIWVLLRKGAPGMTKHKMIEGDWTTTPQQIAAAIPFMEDGKPTIDKILSALDLMQAGGVAVNPSPASPSAGPKAGRARRKGN